ncbi:hypothetical protein CVU37_11570 [candidate division BRC1 bacterium HGW-BRC1-1]|nr:MAG: hypothetical protein CVU37_11570 [candidate division BRC1 bacterium HGW-BRC1-1]
MKRLLVALALGALTVSSTPVIGANMTRSLAGGAGQEAPAPGGAMPGLSAVNEAAPTGSGGWRVLVATGIDEGAAQRFAGSLRLDGYSPVTVETDASGGKAVYVGDMPNEPAARALMDDLVRDKGYSAVGVEGPGQATAPVEQSTLPAATATTKVFRVMVDEFPGGSQQAADSLKKALLDDDYLNVEVVTQPDGNMRVMMGSFPAEADAQKLSSLLNSEGYARASVVTGQSAPVVAAGEAMPQLSNDALAGLTPQQQQEMLKLLRELSAAQAGQAMSLQETEDLRARVKQAQSGTGGNILSTARQSQQDLVEKKKQIDTLYAASREAMMSQKWDDAQAKLDEVRAIAPDDVLLTSKQMRLDNQRKSGATADSPSGNLDELRRLANEAFEKGDLKGALPRYQTLLANNPSDGELANRIGEINNRLEPRKEAEGEAAASTMSSLPPWVMWGGGALLLVVLILAVMQFINMRREKELINEVKGMSASSAKQRAAAAEPKNKRAGRGSITGAAAGGLSGTSTLSGMDAFDPMPDPVDMNADEQPQPEVQEEFVSDQTKAPRFQDAPMGEPDMLVLPDLNLTPPEGVISRTPPPAPIPEPPAPEPVEEAPVAMGDSVDLSNFDFSSLSSPSETPAAPASAPADDSPFGPGGLNLDDLMGASSSPAGVPVPEGMELPDLGIPPMPTPSEGMGSLSLPEDLVPANPGPPDPLPAGFEETAKLDSVPGSDLPPTVDPGETHPKAPAAAQEEAPKVEAPAAPVAPAGPEIFFKQDLTEVAVGQKPAEWQGEYDYASLLVSEENPPNGAGKYLKFEKRTGAGSANFTLRFPNAAGRVMVDFDLRCDDKNKYLLGFYVEKDEDFKQSVHTIVHRIDSKTPPTLRIQGEPIAYELGAWRHIRFEMNLLSGTVTALVDGKQVVRDAKLPSNPAFVNTLSIRDNLATTGVLCLANIQVTGV